MNRERIRAPSGRRASLIGWSATSVLCLGVLATGGSFVDALAHGPYTRWYNRHKFELALAAELVGKPESAIVPALGTPTSIWHSSSAYRGDQPIAVADSITTYNYAPCFFAPCGLFQVHLRNGRVQNLEQLDD